MKVKKCTKCYSCYHSPRFYNRDIRPKPSQHKYLIFNELGNFENSCLQNKITNMPSTKNKVLFYQQENKTEKRIVILDNQAVLNIKQYGKIFFFSYS